MYPHRSSVMLKVFSCWFYFPHVNSLRTHCCVVSVWTGHINTTEKQIIIGKFTIINMLPWNTEIVHWVCTQKLFICHSNYKTIPYSFLYLLLTIYNPKPKLFLPRYRTHKNCRIKEYGHYFREFTGEFKAKSGQEKDDKI